MSKNIPGGDFQTLIKVADDTYITPAMSDEVNAAHAVAADVLIYDKQEGRKFILKNGTDFSKYPADRYIPIGVVVVPGTHNVYGDGSCGVMSLKAMNCDTPSAGSTSEQYILWGVSSTNISGLPNLDQVPIGNTSNGIPTGSTDAGYLPSDRYSDTQCVHDTDAYYSSGISSYIPSPYLTDGNRNPGYYQTTLPSSSSNALADFNGIGNTEKIITQRGTKDYNSWKPTYNSQTDYPAASCCDMFCTEGTSQGDWYLSACGELGYIIPPLNKINDAIDKMHTAYGSSVGVELSTNDYYWSSTESDSNYAYVVGTFTGGVANHNKKYDDRYIRAWLRFK